MQLCIYECQQLDYLPDTPSQYLSLCTATQRQAQVYKNRIQV